MSKKIVWLIFLGIFSAFSQNKSDTEYSGFFDTYYFRGPLNILVGGGMSGYSGDLKKVKPSYTLGAGVSYRVWPRTYFGAQINVVNFSGTDSDTIRNISFQTSMSEFYVYSRFNILDRKMLKNMDVRRKEQFFRPYLTLGIGTNRYNVKSETTNPAWSLDSIPENAKYPKFGFFIPAGIGMAFRITHRFSILTEFNYRFPFTDYLDEVSARGNTKKDIYYSAEIKIQYSPFAIRSKPKKLKYKGPDPNIQGGGGERESGENKEKKPEEKAPETGPSDNNDNLAPTESPEKESPKLEEKQDDGWAEPKDEKQTPKEDDSWANPK